MNRFLTAALGLLLVAGPAAAQSKIGFVDLQRALNEIDEGKAAKALLKKDFDEKQRQLDGKKAEFEKLRADFEKRSMVMNEQARRDQAADLDKRAMELQQTYQQMQGELMKREQEMTGGIFGKMRGLVHEIAAADDLQVVLEANNLVYAQPALDLTNELIRKYNAKYPGGAGGGAAAKPKAAPAKPAGDKK